MEDGAREAASAAAATAAENGAEDYVVVKAAGEGADGQGDLSAAGEPPAAAAAGSEDAAPAVPPATAANEVPEPAESKAPTTKKSGSGDATGERKAKAPNGKVPAAASAVVKAKKPGVLSQSASFPGRGPSGARKAVAATAAATTPKQAKPAVANGSGPAGRVAEKKVSSSRTPVARRSMPVKSGSVDAAAPNDASPAVPDHPGAERTGSGTRIRPSVLYSDRPRRSQHRTPTEHVEHPSQLSSSELEVTNLQTFRAQSVRDSTAFHSDHPGAEGAVTRTRIWQSALYSNRRRRSRRRQAPLPTEELPSEVSSSELHGAVTDLPTLDALSVNDPPPQVPQVTCEDTDDDDDESSHLYLPGDVGRTIGPIGLTRSMYWSLGDSRYGFVSLDEFCRPDSDDDIEELQCMLKEYFDKNPPVSLEEGFASVSAIQNAERIALAAENCTEPPRDPFLVDEEAPSLQAQRQDSVAAAPPEDSMAISHEASTGVINDGKKWMRDEVTLCFRKHVEKTPHLAGLIFELDELCHHCFNVENYMKVFHHYNFKIRMKVPAFAEWTEELYFGEVKEIFGRKFYFCCPLEPNESGHCYACKNQGVEDLKHPVTGGYEIGFPDDPTPNFWYLDEDE